MWQGRFFSYPMDEQYFLRAVRYVELNPVRAGITGIPEEYPWCSARSHILHSDDPVLSPIPVEKSIGDWKAFLLQGVDQECIRKMQLHQKTGRPLGNDNFIDSLEMETQRTLRPQKRGPRISK